MKRLLLLLAAAAPLYSHVGSPDIFFEGPAGPYRLLVTIRPPQVVPGVAEVEVRSATPGAQRVRVAPLRLTAGKQFSPVPDIAQRSPQDPNFFAASVWLMSSGSWKVLIQVDGAAGHGEMAVPVPALSTRVTTMQTTLAVILIPLGLVLVLGLASIVAASVREAQLEPGATPAPERVRRAWIMMGITLAGISGVVYLGGSWWSAEAGDYARIVYKPLAFDPQVDGSQLTLKLRDPGWLNRRVDDLLPDHGHLMHLYIVNVPAIDRAWHLHPEQSAEPDVFTQSLPDMPAGRYALYGDIVHANGLAETATAQLDLPAIAGKPLTGDDAESGAPAPTRADPGVAVLPGGYQMKWERSGTLHARQPYEFTFRLVGPKGADAGDMELYMGMQGHAAFIKDDGSVFAHVHPSGSVPAAVLSVAGGDDPHAMHRMMAAGLPSVVSFPYGFPASGSYRIFVQMKRAGQVVTGLFQANVEN